MIKMMNVSKTIDGRQVLKNVNITLKPGMIAGIVGRNGVGKSTLLRTIAGILDPDEGEVTFNEINIHQRPEIKQKLTYVPDSTEILKTYNVKEIVKLYDAIYEDFDVMYFYSLMDRFQLPKNRKLRTYSKGMKALFLMILSFSTKADFIILDEPTNGLDPIVKRNILQFIIEEVSERQMSVLISTHHLEEVEKMADVLIMLKDGQVESTTSIEEAKATYRKVQAVYKYSLPEKISDLNNVTILSQTGRVYTLMIKGDIEATMEKMRQEQPLLLEELPMTLEDIFISSLGGETHVS
ncbi:ABC transporter ATP-binding protein [Fictibacillus phosphorivorans]|uniref:ABC transporter ATP-binding protein n=1 Tax=Fictibacillus phosphorivorans TaxID=1221500 RepID=UPI00203F5F50|nr:ABC transporter ATP-binding protein [Fictibacillus phosphorivorans]MCM3717437.1 ABC transporter ATP-binding protein [Fictibacillus phosphorivorans]MCM3775132.1 ABC transporter ATP-binding protein [Fictibacillus phosphorivorans]